MSRYRDDLDAAHARIASLEAEVRSLREQAPPSAKPSKQKQKSKPALWSSETLSQNAEHCDIKRLAKILDGSLVSPRARKGGWITLGLFGALHGLLAWSFFEAVRSRVLKEAVLFSYLVPCVLGWWIYRNGRVLADPSFPLIVRDHRGPRLHYRTRTAAMFFLLFLAAVDLLWVVKGLPTMIPSQP